MPNNFHHQNNFWVAYFFRFGRCVAPHFEQTIAFHAIDAQNSTHKLAASLRRSFDAAARHSNLAEADWAGPGREHGYGTGRDLFFTVFLFTPPGSESAALAFGAVSTRRRRSPQIRRRKSAAST